MVIGTAALALIVFLVAWLLFKSPLIGLVLAVLILIFVNGGIYISGR